MYLGVPVISTDCPSGPREILNNGDLGSLVLPGDTESLAKKIIKFLDNGLKIQVPPFIESGDIILVDTRTIEYVKKI